MNRIIPLRLLITIFIVGLYLFCPSQVSAKWWDKFGKPQYGGTMTIRSIQQIPLGTMSFDPNVVYAPQSYAWHYDTLFANNWTTDRDTWSFKIGFVPVEYIQGLLAESWTQVDPVTLVVKLRKGIYWQDKAPVFGREMTAEDVQYSYDRVLGTGSGFTEPSFMARNTTAVIDRVVAIDRYTVEFRFNHPSVFNMTEAMRGTSIIAKEWVENGDLQNCENAVGTGPWIVKDCVRGSSLTFIKNSNYWGHDERYPQNKLPYVDELRVIDIPDNATALSALRTGKIDINTTTIRQNIELKKSDPDIQIDYWPGPIKTLDMRCDTKPFTDINVRKAMQMAIDIKVISDVLYSGVMKGIPSGLISQELTGWAYDYNQWPKGLKEEYRYNPTKAMALLKEAGYPEGFKTDCVVLASENVELIAVFKAFLKDVNIDCNITALEDRTFEVYLNASKHDQMCLLVKSGTVMDPQAGLQQRYSKGPFNYCMVKDARFDNIYEQYTVSVDQAEAKTLCVEMDKYALEQHWAVCLTPIADGIAWQPWIKGYSGEFTIPGSPPGVYFARTWIDRRLKK